MHSFLGRCPLIQTISMDLKESSLSLPACEDYRISELQFPIFESVAYYCLNHGIQYCQP